MKNNKKLVWHLCPSWLSESLFCPAVSVETPCFCPALDALFSSRSARSTARNSKWFLREAAARGAHNPARQQLSRPQPVPQPPLRNATASRSSRSPKPRAPSHALCCGTPRAERPPPPGAVRPGHAALCAAATAHSGSAGQRPGLGPRLGPGPGLPSRPRRQGRAGRWLRRGRAVRRVLGRAAGRRAAVPGSDPARAAAARPRRRARLGGGR